MIEKYKREPEEDLLDRTESIKNLSSLVMSTKESLVMSINADWGAGKTTFVKLWQKHLITQGVHSIYFSAWEDDFSKEPLISILGEINSYINQHFGKKDKDTTDKLDAVKNMGGKILRRGLPAALKGLTGGVLDFEKSIEDAIGAMAEQTAKELIERYSQEKEITQKFREAIKTLLEKIDKDKPFVIFIDELDRCRPLYAIELLERVKHVFGIGGLIFVLSIDKTQLAESIKSQYGNIDTNNYLRRFIDLEYTLQNPSVDKFCEALYRKYEFIAKLKDKHVTKQSGTDINELAMLKYLVKSLHLSLREIEHIFIQIDIFFKTMEDGFPEVYFRVFVFFATLKIKNSQLYFDFISKKLSTDEVEKIVLVKDSQKTEVNPIEVMIEAILKATKLSEEEYWQLVKVEELSLDSFKDTRSIEYRGKGLLINIFKHENNELNRIIDGAIKKLEFIDQFHLSS
ncbi:KAP family P-loop NTPase fold protein [Sulfurospirillum arsenophilum]|uniref:KAP family P-loop NTPase fold protein n=1 Tax=Sulfurospirillum arsenophilum TaxID=56698 RepID=UPI0005AB728D|nr:P-loop NTPase fold protein [Sulfurospirillum arsenophilum]